MQNLNRRRFLGAAIGTGAAAAAAGSWAPAATAQAGGGSGGGRGRVPISNIGIQLYTMRDLMPQGDRRAVRRILNALGEMGYREVEMAGYYGFEARQVRRWVDEAGLRAVSGHDGFSLDPANTGWEEEYKRTLANANTMGQQYTGLAWFGPPYDDAARWQLIASRLQRAGELAREAGLQFFYHNHDFEFVNKQPNGKPYYDLLLQTDRNVVKFELDLYWIVYAGENPLAYLSADPERYPLYHVKDRTWKDRGPAVQDWEDAGPGAIDFPDIFAAGAVRGFNKHYIIEHDQPSLSHPENPEAELVTAQVGIDYLRNVRW
jgi:sugar phosphate isomerase/epimerase